MWKVVHKPGFSAQTLVNKSQIQSLALEWTLSCLSYRFTVLTCYYWLELHTYKYISRTFPRFYLSEDYLKNQQILFKTFFNEKVGSVHAFEY